MKSSFLALVAGRTESTDSEGGRLILTWAHDMKQPVPMRYGEVVLDFTEDVPLMQFPSPREKKIVVVEIREATEAEIEAARAKEQLPDESVDS